MGLEVMAGGAILGGIAGAVEGSKGTPDQTQYTDMTNTSTTSFQPAGEMERQLQQQSLQSYLQQLAQAQAYEQSIGGAQRFQDQSQQSAMGILGGQAFGLTPDEQARIDQLRGSLTAQGNADINQLLDERLAGLQMDAGQRGVRGQAYSQLQGDALRAAATEQARVSNQANQIAAQQAIAMPQQRIAAQSGLIGQGMSFADQMRLQAQQNRIAAQNPYMLQTQLQERLAGGTTTSRQQGTTTRPGQEGSFWGGVQGAIGGAGGFAKSFGDLRSGFNNRTDII